MDRNAAMFQVVERAHGVVEADVRYDIVCESHEDAERIRDVLYQSIGTTSRPASWEHVEDDEWTGETERTGYKVGPFRVWWLR